MIFIFESQCYSSLKVTLPCRKPALVVFYSNIMQGNVWGEVTLARGKQAKAAPEWAWYTGETCRLSCCLACPLSGHVTQRTRRLWVKQHQAHQSLVLGGSWSKALLSYLASHDAACLQHLCLQLHVVLQDMQNDWVFFLKIFFWEVFL